MLSPILARFVATPSLVAPEMREWFESCLIAAASHPRASEMLIERAQADDGFWPPADDWRSAYRPYVVQDGILQIPVKGVLLHDFSFALGGWATGYVYIWRAFQRGMDDPAVTGIALICDSPGGHVAGNFDLVDRMYAMQGTKPVWAFAHEAAYSAAYSIASVADRIWVSRTGGVGSIGVVAAHLDVSGAMEQAGLKVTFIFAGRHKVDGNAYEALPDDVRERLQMRIDQLYAVFTATVSRNRGLSEQAVRDTEALCFSAAEAVSNRLADEIGSLDDAVAAFAADLSRDEEDEPMTGQSTTASPSAGQGTKQSGASGSGPDLREVRRQAAAQARAEERVRIGAIVDSEEAKDRTDMARHLAFSTDMSADAARELLGKSPKAEAAKPANRFEAAMTGAGNPQVGPDQGGDGNKDESLAFADGYFAAKRQKRSA